jgi:SAM-dependent methyltransferase
MHRVANTRDGRFFKIWGLKCYGDFLEILRRHCDLARPAALLDWGCGCGRLTAHFLSEPGFAVFGCDVDREAVTWCESNLRAGQFTTIDPFPPTPYPDGSFQLAIGYSIFTHLTKDLQFAWLAELQRILAPGGILVATVHGDSAASFAFPGQVSTVLEHGFYDGVHDTVLDGTVPQGYYRGTFQTQEYTLREWGKYFDILEYEVRGIGNHQDAVVMRSRA